MAGTDDEEEERVGDAIMEVGGMPEAAMDMDAEPAGIGCGLRLDARTLVVAG